MSDDIAKAIADAQKPLLEQMAGIEKILRTIAAAQVAPLLYEPQELASKVAGHIEAAETWRNERDAFHALETPDALGLGDEGESAKKLQLRRVQDANHALKTLTDDEPVIAALARAKRNFP